MADAAASSPSRLMKRYLAPGATRCTNSTRREFAHVFSTTLTASAPLRSLSNWDLMYARTSGVA